jgi:hypothetical protein
MSDSFSRREWLQAVSAAGAAGAIATGTASASAPNAPQTPAILPLSSTSDVFIPGRGRAFHKFSFDFPEPSVEFAGLRFGFLIFTRENVYGLDQSRMQARQSGDTLTLEAGGLVWAGGQERAPGRLTARFRRNGQTIEWDATAEMDQPVKTVTTIVRGVPRGRISVAGGNPFDPQDHELLYGYPFGAGNLFGGNNSQGLGTPYLSVVAGEQDIWSLTSLDDKVRAKRFYFQPGERGYRVELVFEAEGWLEQRRVDVPAWRISRSTTIDAATETHYAHLERAYRLPAFAERTDSQPWLKDIGLVLQLHGAHYTGFLFNDYARMREILRWTATQIPAERVLAFFPAWDGRYYWNYPLYKADERMGGEAGFRELIREAKQLGFKTMPMFGMNTANKGHPEFSRFADAVTRRIDGDQYDLDWVDWNNDRHQEGWVAYMNLGVDSWRQWLAGRIADVVDRYGVDAYFLDISGGWVNNTKGDMHEGTRRLVADLRRRYPNVLACGEFHYDAMLGLFPLFHVYSRPGSKYCRFFSHLSMPAPGRGSSGVHEAGFGRWNETTLMMNPGAAIPTISVVDDTFTKHRAVMAAAIARAKEIGGIG